MNNLMKKSKKGFTLMEMLIVVAIIAILVVIAIPTFTNALTEARENADLANIRAWYAEVCLEVMLDDGDFSGVGSYTGSLQALDAGDVVVNATSDSFTVTVTTSTGDVVIGG